MPPFSPIFRLAELRGFQKHICWTTNKVETDQRGQNSVDLVKGRALERFSGSAPGKHLQLHCSALCCKAADSPQRESMFQPLRYLKSISSSVWQHFRERRI
ncbi:protein yippee-like 2 isoform X2 [Gopherus evgoodei]|uniref:protein yippee-like 2 isoform X2 n=1 Tax=Gopherus evgoodei TaxID=1825980 RepID=UPI0011D03198|nr:protein yippee-like 2 isoform X2 [Gopherus evgoodei]